MSAARRITSQLPADLTTFVGREHELDEATRLLRSARLVTLLGVGGVGKTSACVHCRPRNCSSGWRGDPTRSFPAPPGRRSPATAA